MKKFAVILFNLGGPSDLKAVQPFLFNLFYDHHIISLPNPLRWFIAKLISIRRAPIAREIYEKMGGKSPILDQTKKQADKLEEYLNNNGEGNKFKCFISMRYYKPFSYEIKGEIEKFAPDEILLLPLYPQYSTTTTLSSVRDFNKNCNLKKKVKLLCCYPKDDKFIESYRNLIAETYLKIVDKSKIRILFSAHGLPESIIKKGDPYQWQVEETCKELVSKLSIHDLDYVICYQSRVGPVKWIEPSTDNEIIKASREKKIIIVVPIAFVSEHSETVVELDIEYKHLAEKHGAEEYHRVPTVSIETNFIKSLGDNCLKLSKKQTDKLFSVISNEDKLLCPKEFCQCINRIEV